jgi:hypothetical protein
MLLSQESQNKLIHRKHQLRKAAKELFQNAIKSLQDAHICNLRLHFKDEKLIRVRVNEQEYTPYIEKNAIRLVAQKGKDNSFNDGTVAEFIKHFRIE